MAIEPPIIPLASAEHEQPPPPPDLRVDLPPPTMAETQAADETFKSRDAELVAGIIGWYGSGMLLRDLAWEHLYHNEEEEEEEEPRDRDDFPDEDPAP
jgi:hypothetical protein